MDVAAWFGGLACIAFGLLLLAFCAFLLVDTYGDEQ